MVTSVTNDLAFMRFSERT